MTRTDVDPTPLLTLLSGGPFGLSDQEFNTTCATLRQDLAPVGVLEMFLVAMVLQAAWRLRRSYQREAEVPPGDKDWMRYHLMAERGFWKALRELEKLRKARAKAASESEGETDPASPVPPAAPEPDHPGGDLITTAAPGSAANPRLRRTGTPVVDLLTWIKNGKSVPEILRHHQGVTEADLRACQAWDAARPREVSSRR